MIARSLAVAEGIRSRSPELWSPYVETAVDVTRAAAIPGGYVGGAVQCGRIAPPALAPANDRPRSRALVLAQIRVSRREIGEQLFGLLERIAGLGLTLRSLTRLEAESGDSTGASSARRAASSP